MNVFLEKYDLIGPVAEVPPHDDILSFLGGPVDKDIPFIHSYMFGVSNFGFKNIKNVFDKYTTISKFDSMKVERMITSSVLINGGKIKSFLKYFENIDLNKDSNWDYNIFNKTRKASCYEVPKNYFGLDLNPFEVIFVKNIRNNNENRTIELSGISDELYFQLETYKKWTNN
jgi:hypothetical protein